MSNSQDPAGLTAAEIRELVGRPDPVILEVGANCGQSTAQFLQAMPQATIHAFEPDPRAIAKFRQAVRHPNVTLHACAVGASTGTIAFHQSSGAEHLPGYPQGWDQSGSIRKPLDHLRVWPWVRFEKQIQVPLVTLDGWMAQWRLPRVDFIWADVQGAEGDLLAGGAETVNRARYFYTEFSDTEWYEGQVTLADLVQRLPGFELVRRYPMDALFRNRLAA